MKWQFFDLIINCIGYVISEKNIPSQQKAVGAQSPVMQIVFSPDSARATLAYIKELRLIIIKTNICKTKLFMSSGCEHV